MNKTETILAKEFGPPPPDEPKDFHLARKEEHQKRAAHHHTEYNNTKNLDQKIHHKHKANYHEAMMDYHDRKSKG